LVKFVFSCTDGNPFFIEELVRHLMDQAKLFDTNGQFRRDLTISEVEIPQSLRLIIGRRLAHLSAQTTEVLGPAAVIGRSFGFELLEAATPIDAESLLDSVEEAERAGIILASTQQGETRFQFAHELVRKR